MSLASKFFASLAVLALSLGVTSYYLQATVFAPEQTRAAVDTVLADPAVQDLVADRLMEVATQTIAERAAELLPPGIDPSQEVTPEQLEAAGVDVPADSATVTAAEVESAVRAAVADPRLAAAAADAVVVAHEVLIGEASSAPVVDASVASTVLVDALRPISSEVADAVASAPISVELPVRELPLASLLNAVTAAAAFGLVVAGTVLGALAVALSPRRDRTMRRIGIALVSVTLLQALVLWLLPRFVAPELDSTLAQTVGSVLSALGSQAIPYLAAALGAGVALAALSPLLRPRPRPAAPPVPPGGIPVQGTRLQERPAERV